jgi:hypothetical protein
MRALEDENIARRPTREYPIADIQRVAKEVLVDDVGDKLPASRPFNRNLDIGPLIFDHVDRAEHRIGSSGGVAPPSAFITETRSRRIEPTRREPMTGRSLSTAIDKRAPSSPALIACPSTTLSTIPVRTF